MVKDAKLKPDAVKTMLKYIYSDFKDVADIAKASVSVWDVLYAGNQFCIVALATNYEFTNRYLLSIGTGTDNFILN